MTIIDTMMKTLVKRLPWVGPTLVSTRKSLRDARFPGSAGYWERRYRKGGTSGAGSYGEIARYKARILNGLVEELGVTTVIEFGCGDGAQLKLATYPTYLGLDVSRTAVQLCQSLFSKDKTKSFILYDPEYFENNGAVRGEMVISLDVILHLVEDSTLARYLKDLDKAGSRYLVFYTEDTSFQSTSIHVRYRQLSEWVGMLPDWKLTRTVANPAKGADTMADFFLFERIPKTMEING